MRDVRIPVDHTCPTIDKIKSDVHSINKFLKKIEDGDEDEKLFLALSNLTESINVHVEKLRSMALALRTHGNRALMELEQRNDQDQMIIDILQRKTMK